MCCPATVRRARFARTLRCRSVILRGVSSRNIWSIAARSCPTSSESWTFPILDTLMLCKDCCIRSQC